ncbi:dipeptide/oligopeptide/nickel ABC transporter permease/ATP-binding protein [Rhodococcus sp. 14-2483-1-2]|uniref:dipeptide/oligopeptide/nickel ABC transporter permease/ATP-binding protein n=1 Tax=Rhodococcus sp. 14-2483-1-2 TaxID=2023147 RepID=UPI000B9B1259|nr:dipeptide/oligopeptide/nickel ABC transporter permease/ATP-binding protein [Rhodococcus sp. 14-2483-1-2]OZF26075.1 hypothetical protein CH295_25945 [Rhodococcus sp. 14-2483-1-2]
MAKRIDIPPTDSAWAPLIQLVRTPVGVLSLAWLTVVIVLALLAPILPLADPLQQDLSRTLQLPSTANLLGTDALGRDVLARIVFGARPALSGAATATLIALALGGTIGVLTGWAGGRWAATGSRLADLLFALPAIVILLAFAAILGRDVSVSMIVYGILASAFFVRLAQSATTAVRHELFVDAARVSGVPRSRILISEILPNVAGPLIIQTSLTFGAALLIMASLGFLGLGAPPPAPDWGSMIADATKQIFVNPWFLLPTGVVLALTIIAANVLGDIVRDGDERSRPVNHLFRARDTAPLPSTREGSDALLTVDDLHVNFPDTGDVVRGVSFHVGRGEVVGLVGESGSGKTMTALSIIGLLPDPGHISDGGLSFDGTELVGMSEKQRRAITGSDIAVISQEPMSALDPSYTVRSHLIPAIRRHRNVSRKDAVDIARQLLADVGLPDPDAVLRRYPFELSGGMAQRVAIALALTGSPQLLIADEPTTALDVTVQAGVLDLLRSLQIERGMSILFVTHDLGVVADICERVYVMKGGEIVESGVVTEIFTRPRAEYTQALIAATPDLQKDISMPPTTMQEAIT